MDWIDVRAELPWIGHRPFWVAADDVTRLESALTSLGFEVHRFGGVLLDSPEAFRSDIARALDLASYSSKNWDAFADAFGDLVRGSSKPLALIWSDPASAFASDLSFGLRLFDELSSTLRPWNCVGPGCRQIELILAGRKTSGG